MANDSGAPGSVNQPGRSSMGSTPNPDPTERTREDLLRTIQAEREITTGQLDVIRQRLDDMDRAGALLHSQVTQVPSDVDNKIAHLRELVDERFRAVGDQFAERDRAVRAALAAQKEAATKRDETNQKAIDKSELATSEAINKLGELFRTTTDALADKLEDVKGRVATIESTGGGRQQAYSGIYMLAGFIVLILVIVAAVSGWGVGK